MVYAVGAVLYELMTGEKVPEEFRPYVNDYKINLLEIAYLTDEQVKFFKSDFRIVTDYFVQIEKE